jgi:hypothetical protein
MTMAKLGCLVVAYGMGVDSTAMLIGLHQRKIYPDAILFADTGSERPETYPYQAVMDGYLKKIGFPPITVVRTRVRDFKNYPPYHSLEENCLTNGTLPSVAFGWQRKTCSEKWKARPQQKWIKTFAPAQECWAAGRKVLRAIGFDDTPADQKRRTYADTIKDDKFECWYPLQDWGWDRNRCIQEIEGAGLPVPCKSSCYFCPAMKPWEVRTLPRKYLKRIVLIEARAQPRLRTIKGLWGMGRKGNRGGIRMPGRMTDFILEEGLLSAQEIQQIQSRVPLELVPNLELFVQGWQIPTWQEFLAGMEDPCVQVA